MTIAYDIELDVRHEESPIPTIRTKETLDTLTTGGILKVLTSKESTVQNIRTLVKNQAFELLLHVKVEDSYVFFIKKL